MGFVDPGFSPSPDHDYPFVPNHKSRILNPVTDS